MKKLISCIITYNPELARLKENISSIIHQIDKILIIDNGSKNINEIKDMIKYSFRKEIQKIHFIINKENKGIAYTLNQGLNYANEHNYKWIFTLDQDSICDDNIIEEMKKYYQGCNIKDKIAIIAPNAIDENKKSEIEQMYTDVEFPVAVITSGALTNVKKCIDVGGFLEKLFIDYVDHEICLRLKDNGYEIVKLKKAKLYHELGEIKIHSILGKKATTTNHSALRRYYYFRNGIYVHKNYNTKFFEWIKDDIRKRRNVIIGIILFEENKLNKLKYVYKGIKDGKKNIYGKIKL